MYCGVNYTDSCAMNADFDCNCPFVPTPDPTTSPTMALEIDCYGTECAGQELVCYGWECYVRCFDEESCLGATMRNGDGHKLEVDCMADGACSDAIIYGAHRVRAQAPNALSGAVVYGYTDSSITTTVECQQQSSCSKAEVIGSDSYRLSVECSEHESCHDMTIHCPPSDGVPRCSVKGEYAHSVQPDIHNELVLYAPNGWSDIEFVDYTAFVSNGRMICGGNQSRIDSMDSMDSNSSSDDLYECQIEYGVWDCRDRSSPCSDQEWIDHAQTFLCDETNRCNDGETFSCEEAADGTSCDLLCVADGSCSGLTFNCHINRRCNIVCAGEGSCDGLSVDAVSTTWAAGDWTVLCGKDGNEAACRALNVTSHRFLSGFGLQVYVYGFRSMHKAFIQGPSGDGSYGLNVQCNHRESCNGATFSADLRDFHEYRYSPLTIACNGAQDSCSDITVYCPDDESKHCVVRGDSVDHNVDLQLFAVNGFDDIDLSGWTNKEIAGINNRMHCGEAEDGYPDSCVIKADSFRCSCGDAQTFEPTQNPTEYHRDPVSQPTAAPTVPTTNGPSNDPTTNPIYNVDPVTQPTPSPVFGGEPTNEPTREPTPRDGAPTAQPTKKPTKESAKEDQTAVIVGSVFGALAAIIVIVAVVFLVKGCCCDKQNGYEATDTEEMDDQ